MYFTKSSVCFMSENTLKMKKIHSPSSFGKFILAVKYFWKWSFGGSERLFRTVSNCRTGLSRYTRSGLTMSWTISKGSLLELRVVLNNPKGSITVHYRWPKNIPFYFDHIQSIDIDVEFWSLIFLCRKNHVTPFYSTKK